MKCFFQIALVIALSSAVQAANPSVRISHDVTFLAADRAEKLDLYVPAAASGVRRPAMIWIHGGGWTGGDKRDARAREVCETFSNAGYVTISIDYKLGEGAWPQNLLDCKNAVRYLRAHAAELQVDPNRIGVAGGSAGAHLALMVGMTAGLTEFEPPPGATPYAGVSSAVRCVIDMYGPTSLLTREETDGEGRPVGTRKAPANAMEVFGTKDTNSDIFRAASPVTHVNKNSPPVLILHGKLDPQVDMGQSRTLAAALKSNGVDHELLFVEGAGHSFNFETWNEKPLVRDLRPIALAFLAKHLGPAPKS
jgi:acetyl esterase/lipase